MTRTAVSVILIAVHKHRTVSPSITLSVMVYIC